MENEKIVSRRNVLCGLAVMALGLVPDKAIAATGVKVLADGKVEISISNNPALRKVGGVVVCLRAVQAFNSQSFLGSSTDEISNYIRLLD